MKGYKGFDKDLKCRDFQYQIGQVYETDKKPVRCTSNGFHFCENPLDVLAYYPAASSRYCEVEGEGDADRDNDDSKVAVSKIRIGAEIGLNGLINAGVKFILEKVKWEEAKESNTGNWSAATNTGNHSAATNTGDHSAATNTGYQSAASVEGKESVAMSVGVEGKAKGALGCWIVLAEWDRRDDGLHRKDVQCAHVDGERIKADTWYQLVNGKFTEV